MKFDELSEKVKERVINDFISLLIDITDFSTLSHNSNLYRAYKESDKMKTPWFIGEYIWEYCEKQILKELRKYRYTKEGKVIK